MALMDRQFNYYYCCYQLDTKLTKTVPLRTFCLRAYTALMDSVHVEHVPVLICRYSYM